MKNITETWPLEKITAHIEDDSAQLDMLAGMSCMSSFRADTNSNEAIGKCPLDDSSIVVTDISDRQRYQISFRHYNCQWFPA